VTSDLYLRAALVGLTAGLLGHGTWSRILGCLALYSAFAVHDVIGKATASRQIRAHDRLLADRIEARIGRRS